MSLTNENTTIDTFMRLCAIYCAFSFAIHISMFICIVERTEKSYFDLVHFSKVTELFTERNCAGPMALLGAVSLYLMYPSLAAGVVAIMKRKRASNGYT